jgi:hypothetical protein
MMITGANGMPVTKFLDDYLGSAWLCHRIRQERLRETGMPYIIPSLHDIS